MGFQNERRSFQESIIHWLVRVGFWNERRSFQESFIHWLVRDGFWNWTKSFQENSVESHYAKILEFIEMVLQEGPTCQPQQDGLFGKCWQSLHAVRYRWAWKLLLALGIMQTLSKKFTGITLVHHIAEWHTSVHSEWVSCCRHVHVVIAHGMEPNSGLSVSTSFVSAVNLAWAAVNSLTVSSLNTEVIRSNEEKAGQEGWTHT